MELMKHIAAQAFIAYLTAAGNRIAMITIYSACIALNTVQLSFFISNGFLLETLYWGCAEKFPSFSLSVMCLISMQTFVSLLHVLR